ncbi:hypothetical protein AZZ69_004625, partial [Klebsiella pneumoniae]
CLRGSFIHVGSDHRIPKHINDADKKKNKACRCRADSIYRQHMQSQKTPNGAENQVLRKVAHAITNSFSAG